MKFSISYLPLAVFATGILVVYALGMRNNLDATRRNQLKVQVATRKSDCLLVHAYETESNFPDVDYVCREIESNLFDHGDRTAFGPQYPRADDIHVKFDDTAPGKSSIFGPWGQLGPKRVNGYAIEELPWSALGDR